MAWLQVHQTLKDHRKLFDAADQLEVEPPHMMGLLVSFWLWALDNAPTGSLVDITPRMISRAAQWDGDPEKLAKTLIRAGWMLYSGAGSFGIICRLAGVELAYSLVLTLPAYPLFRFVHQKLGTY